MKYQVGFIYTYEGEASIEADTEEEAREMLREITFSDPFNEPELNGNSTTEILEVYEWDEAAQERNHEQIIANFKALDERKRAEEILKTEGSL